MSGIRRVPSVKLDVDGLIEEARAAERASRFDAARTRYEAALYRLPPGEAATASALLRWIARTHEASGDMGAAMDCLEAALASARAAESTPDIAHALNFGGILHFRRGQLEKAEELYCQAREIAVEASEVELVAMVDQNLGNVANIHGDHDLARTRYQQSLQGYKRLGLEEYVGPLLNNLGRLHTDVGDWGEADTVFRLAKASCEQVGNLSYQVLVEVNRARLHLATGDLARAREACDVAHEGSLALSEDRWLGEIHKQTGVVLRELGRPRMAEAEFARGILEAERREELLLEAEISKELAFLYSAEKRYTKMLECLNRAHEAFESLRARRDLDDVTRQIGQLEKSFEVIVAEWGDSIESKDRYTQGHCQRVADHACELALAAGLDAHVLSWFRMGALLHDLGKVEVPSEILNKAGALDDDEWKVMKAHPERGVHLLASVEFPWDIRPMVLHHHEHWDGGGYPHGLQGEAIPLSARILCVADVFDALTTTRSYRTAFTPQVALEIMEGDAGHVFDPELFGLFRHMMAPRVTRGVRRPLFWDRALHVGTQNPFERRPPLYAVA